jgi:tetratricopeptide (TPR) repeat protein
MPHDVFLSHSSKDKLAADAACAVLESEGIRCWIAPRDITPGAEWSASIIDAIGEVKVFVLLFSQHANESHQIQREVELAVGRGIPIVPVRLERVSPSRSLGFFISTQHWLDAFSPPLQRHLAYLVRIVRGLLDDQPIEPVLPQPIPSPLPLPTPRRLPVWQIAGGAVAAVAVLLLALRLFAPAAAPPTTAANAVAPLGSNAAAASAAPQPPAPDWAGCDESPTVAGCSVIIREGADAPQNMAVAYLRRAIAYHAAGDAQHAIADDDEAIRLNPAFAVAFANRGAAYADQGNFSQAIHDYDSAIALKPDLGRTFSNRCFARAALNLALDQALADCNQALKLDPDDVNAKSNRGFVYVRLGKLPSALDDLNSALAIDPARADALFLRGLVKRGQGDATGSAADIGAATASDRTVVSKFARWGLVG